MRNLKEATAHTRRTVQRDLGLPKGTRRTTRGRRLISNLPASKGLRGKAGELHLRVRDRGTNRTMEEAGTAEKESRAARKLTGTRKFLRRSPILLILRVSLRKDRPLRLT